MQGVRQLPADSCYLVVTIEQSTKSNWSQSVAVKQRQGTFYRQRRIQPPFRMCSKGGKAKTTDECHYQRNSVIGKFVVWTQNKAAWNWIANHVSNNLAIFRSKLML